MGKKIKKERSGNKEKRDSISSTKGVQKANMHASKIVDNGAMLENERRVCVHFERGVNVAKVISKLKSAESNGCEDCREGVSDRKDGKGKGKHGRKKGSSNATWICLHCGQFSCGGAGLPNSRQTHAVQHSSQSRHPLVIQMENTKLRWCFSCKSFIPVDKVDGNGDNKDVLSDIVNLLKKQSSKTTSVDEEDTWFGSESVNGNVKSGSDAVSLPNGTDFYAVRGLANLGNTCFFNSVMQNLLAIHTLREYLLTFDGLMGPLTSALKKIYAETSSESGVRNVINPQPLFGCICARSSQFRGYQQQDSHELLRCLLDELSTEESRTKKSRKSSQDNLSALPASPTFIDAIFGGQISSTVCCVECGHSSTVHEPFLDLSLPLPAEKIPPKKARPTSRTKKTKLPPKRASKNRPELNKDTDSHPTVSGCDPLSYGEYSSILKEKLLGCSSSADLVESTAVADSRGLGSQNKASTLEEDVVVQLDYPGAVTQSNAREGDSWLDYLGPVGQSDTQEAVTLDCLEPVCLSDEQNSCVKNEHGLIKQESVSDMNYNIDSLHNAVNPNDGRDETVGDRKKDTETSLLMVSDEDTLDFVGLGDLFDEPEAVTTSRCDPDELDLRNGLLAGSDAGCDPEELDDKDLPVSVESCLAHFVKTELLSGEHPWHCENCSKLQQEEKRNLKKQQKSSPVLQENVPKDECPSCHPVQINGFGPTLPEEYGERYEPKIACSDANGVSDCCTRFADQDPFERQSGSEEHVSSDEEEEDDNDINTSSVKVMRDATKRILISKSPSILTIHLKRFGRGTRGRLSKLNGHVVFKEFIDLQPYLDNRSTLRDKCIYRLVGVVEHSGSMTGGHYVAYVRGGYRSKVRSEDENHRLRQNVWYHASDAYVRETTLEKVLRSEAYILFYEKVQL